VKLVSEALPPGCKSREQIVKNMGAVWIVECPKLPSGQFLEAERIYELTRTAVMPGFDPETLRRPGKLTPELRGHLQNSPGIEIGDTDLKNLAMELTKSHPSPWEFADEVRGWIGKNVTFELGSFQGAKTAYENRKGDCEDVSALFIALCRIQGIPARSVWVEGHAYPEFFLEDGQGNGHWIPVEIPGSKAIGQISETRPILQKGDQYRDPISKQRLRYLPQQAVAFGGQAKLAITRTILEEQPNP
jgi:transglutaminase-like putative cysteine protease